MRFICLPLVLCILCTAVFAQKQPRSKRLPNPKTIENNNLYAKGRLFIKLNFFDLIGPETPTIQPSIEARFSKTLAAEVIAGFPVRTGDLRNSDTLQNNYYKLKAELKFYFFQERLLYLAPQIFMGYQERDVKNGFYTDEHGGDYRFASAV